MKKGEPKDNPNRTQAEPPTKDITKSMPFSDDAEKGLLSCFLHNPTDLLSDAKAMIAAEAFYHPINRLLYNIMLDFKETSKPVEYIALSNFLRDTEQMDKVGGQGILAELLDFVPTPTHYGYYKKILLEKYTLRRGIALCTGTLQRSYEYQEDVNEWARQFSEDAVEFYQGVVNGAAIHAGSDLATVHDDMIAMSGVVGESTELKWLDKYFGGLQKTSLFLVGGKEGAGKSSLVRQIGWRCARRGIPTDLITVEMSKVQYYACLCCLEGVSSESVLTQKFSSEEVKAIRHMREIAPSIPLRIHDDISTIQECVSRIQLGVLQRKVRVVVVDMPQRLSGDNPKNRERELSGIFWLLKQCAKKFSITIIAPIHLNADLGALGAKDIYNHADQVMIMAPNSKHEPGLLESRLQILFKIIKNRFGHNYKRCLYWFDGPHYEFTEAEETDLDILTKEDAKEKKKEGKRK